MRRALPYAVLAAVQLGAALVFLLDAAPGTRAALDGLPLDDAWIHLVYARSLAAFEGFAYNPGALETGFASPLWVVLLAPLHWLAPLWGGGQAGEVADPGFSRSVRNRTSLDGHRALPVDEGFAHGELVDLLLEIFVAEFALRRLGGVDREGVFGEPATIAAD